MYVRVHVVAAAKREQFVSEKADVFRVSVREPAAQNMANRRVAALLAMHFGVVPRAVRLVTGHRSPTKLFEIES